MTNLACIDTSDAHTPYEVFFQLCDVPVHCNVQWPSADAARAAPRGDLQLAFCPGTGHLFNPLFDPALTTYDREYENSLHFSPRFQRYVADIVDDLIERHDLRHKTVVDIGCGKGEFLELLCAMGDNRGTGFDASAPTRPDAPPGVTYVRDFYRAEHTHIEADLIVCRHVLEHIADPVAFLSLVRQAAGNPPHTVVFFEVPNALYTLRDLGVWDIIYEHCSYFTPNSLAALFTRCGFAVDRLRETYGGQFLTIEAHPAPLPVTHEPHPTMAELPALIRGFHEKYRHKMAYWRDELDRRYGSRVVIWGSGSKGVTFLNALKLTPEQVAYAVDINPRKHGRFVAGTGQQIVAPGFLREYQPATVLVMNPLYEIEIRDRLHGLGLTPEVMVV